MKTIDATIDAIKKHPIAVTITLIIAMTLAYVRLQKASKQPSCRDRERCLYHLG